MLKIEQYNSIFSIYVYVMLVLPVVILALCEKKSKVLNLCISAVMIILLFGIGSLQMWEFLAFLVLVLGIIFSFYFFRKHSSSEMIYFMLMLLAIMPLAIVKIEGKE